MERRGRVGGRGGEGRRREEWGVREGGRGGGGGGWNDANMEEGRTES